MIITAANLTAISANCLDADDWATALNTVLPLYDIDTPARAAAFLAQTMYESSEFKILEENLNYSAAGLRATFPSYFRTTSLSYVYQHSPQRIASYVYANRLGNGDQDSGDGWTYRGRGLIQITGKYNYGEIGSAWGQDPTLILDYMLTPEGACKSAAWYWETNGLNDLADDDEFTTITIKINGSTNGIAARKALWALACRTLGA